MKGKEECVRGGWEKFGGYARHAARISIRLWTDMLNLRANKLTENVLLDQLFVFVFCSERLQHIMGEWRPEDLVDCSGVSHCRLFRQSALF